MISWEARPSSLFTTGKLLMIAPYASRNRLARFCRIWARVAGWAAGRRVFTRPARGLVLTSEFRWLLLVKSPVSEF
jgi:hypothetical protein